MNKRFASFLLFFICISTAHTISCTYDESWVHRTVHSLSLQEKIGQLFIVAARSDDSPEPEVGCYNTDQEYIEKLIVDYHIGGIIFLGTHGIPKNQIDVTRSFQNLNAKHNPVPLFIALDAEWGLSMRLDNVISFPRNNVLGALNNPNLVYETAREIGRQLALIGVHINLAPVVDVNSNPNNPVIGSRSFGSDPHAVAHNGIAFARGLHDAGILACAKHFPGHGDTATDSHFTLPLINHPRERLDKIELLPFIELIKHAIPAIMTAHLAIPALEPDLQKPTSLSYHVVTDLLKNELHFDGLIITDGLGMRGASEQYEPGELELYALLAGNDILLCPLDVPKAVQLIEQAIIENRFSEEELNNRVYKILHAKAWAFNQHPDSFEPVYDYEQLHTPYAYALQARLRYIPTHNDSNIPEGY